MIGFVAAEHREFSGLLKHLRNEQKAGLDLQWALSGTLNGAAVALAAHGPGPLLARRAAEVIGERWQLTALVSYGFCGSLDPSLSLNQVVTWGRSPNCPTQKSALKAAAHSLDKVIVTAKEKTRLRDQTGAEVVEMEAAGVQAYARDRDIPFYAVRIVTDTAAEDLPMDFNLLRDAQGRFSRSKILAHAIRHPSLLPKLMELNRRTDAASAALGDFVACCQF